MERTAYSVSAKNCPRSKQDSFISSGNSCSCIFRQGGLKNVSALSWRHVLKSCREGAGAKENGDLCECFPAYKPKHRGSVVGLAGTLEG